MPDTALWSRLSSSTTEWPQTADFRLLLNDVDIGSIHSIAAQPTDRVTETRLTRDYHRIPGNGSLHTSDNREETSMIMRHGTQSVTARPLCAAILLNIIRCYQQNSAHRTMLHITDRCMYLLYNVTHLSISVTAAGKYVASVYNAAFGLHHLPKLNASSSRKQSIGRWFSLNTAM